MIDPGAPNPEFGRPADRATLERVAEALAANGFKAQVAATTAEARELVLELIPEGAEVHGGLSETLKALGVSQELEESGRYDSIRAKLNQLDRDTQFREMRKLAGAPDYMIGSAAAVTEDGHILVGSGSGSQLGAYAYAAGEVIIVVGHQKIVRSIEEGLRRLKEYSLPREWERMQGIGYPGTRLSKILILNYEAMNRITVILVDETLGF
jgi:hypothetical protein